MPNMKGGKGYKKGSHESAKQPECNWEDGQQYGRILRALGNRRFRVLCNDGKERICKLAGSLRKSQWCEEGTFIILSLRGLSSGTASMSTEEVGDILDVVEHSWVSKLKKDEKINKTLFGTDQQKNEKETDDLFDENDSADEENESTSDSDSKEKMSKTVEEIEEERRQKANAREKKAKERDQQRSSRRDVKNHDSGEINIDAI
jgi:initiation factor 1A